MFDLQVGALDRVLPVNTLQNVKDLDFHCFVHENEPLWPTTWSQLTNLTRLALQCEDADEPGFHFPEFITDLRSLKDLEYTIEIGDFYSSGEEYIVLMTRCLKQLTRLQINVAGSLDPELFRSAFDSTNIKQMCQSVIDREPGMLYSLTEPDNEGFSPNGRLVFTL
jgi:hypothetical protein